MPHRIFIAINLSKGIRERLYSVRDEYPDLPCRWTKKENLHLTVMFLGYLADEEVLDVCRKAGEIGARRKPFWLELKRIVYGPPKKKPPRMVWAEGKPSRELSLLEQDLKNSFFETVVPEKPGRTPAFSPHVTLGRLKQWEFQKQEIDEVPEINEEISLKFEVRSVEVMESELRREGPEYQILESAPLLKE